MENAQRKREILDVCLATFIRRGLYETSVRDLSRALALQSGGIYYWFKDKTMVVTCAEEAALRLRSI
ncbi:MAG: TetR/AcrR family transcriptional regulator [Oscillospiraceae bacterium]